MSWETDKAASIVRTHAPRLGLDAFAAEQIARAIEAIQGESPFRIAE